MLIERIKTSLWIPKIIFGTTIVLSLFAVSMAYAYITMEPSEMIQDAARVQDTLTYKVITDSRP
jgi:hypothetical protein